MSNKLTQVIHLNVLILLGLGLEIVTRMTNLIGSGHLRINCFVVIDGYLE